MKFNKTVAQALANKTRQQLYDARRKFLDNFKVSEKEANELKAMIDEKFALTARLKELNQAISNKSFGLDCAYNDTPTTLFTKCVRKIGEHSLKAMPAYDTLVDDFLIESLEAENAEDLIAKVTAKYSA